MWLDDAPRCSEFSSASSSPSQLFGDDQDSQKSQTSSKQDDKEKVRSLHFLSSSSRLSTNVVCFTFENETFKVLHFKTYLLQDGGAKRKSGGTSSKANAASKDGSKDSGATASIPKRRTTERLQPGKSKGNLISNIQGDMATSKESRAAAVSSSWE